VVSHRAVLFSLALGAFYLLHVAPLYHIQARVLVQRQGLPLSQERPTKDNVEFLATQAEIIRSPAIIEQAVRSLDFSPYKQPELDPTVEILKSLMVQPVLGTNVLSVDFLDLSELERQYRSLRKKSPLMGQGKDAISIQRALLTQLGEKLTDARNRRIELENRLQTLGDASQPVVAAVGPSQPPLFAASFSKPWQPSSSISQPGTSLHDGTLPPDFERWYSAAENGGIELGDIRPIRQQLFLAQTRQEALAQRFGSRHPEMRAVEQEVATW